MKHIYLLATFLFFSIAFLTTSCKKDDDGVDSCSDFVYADAISDEVELVSQAATTYGMDPTTENCLDYKDAYRDYIDALEGFENCIRPDLRNQWEEDLDDARASIDELECS